MHKEFEVHQLNEVGIVKAKAVALEFDRLLDYVETVVPLGRELSIVKTKLEESCFFAKKGIANALENQRVQ